jgi:CubicO group peptidase (beta-lactamase class C family)
MKAFAPPRRGIGAARRAAGVLFIGCALFGTVTASAAEIPSQGSAWDALESKVDVMVKGLIAKSKLPGMTVAVTQEGRLILSKGYGYANTSTKTVMTDQTRSRIGSVTKATITGPAAFQLMKAKGIDPKTKLLYGDSGVLGNTFYSNADVAVTRFTPIVALSINPEDKAYAWYSDGTVSAGATNKLDQFVPPKPYTLPAGKKPIDIREIGIAKDGRSYVWYDDGKLSIGTATDLDYYRGLSEEPVKLPAGKTMEEIVGIDIAKSNDHVYVWYEDGTVSSGTSTDFDYYYKPKPAQYADGSGFTSYNVRGMGIASNDHVYVWFGYGKASSGTATKLDQYLGHYSYTAAPAKADDWHAWFGKITIQNLLDHRAGFTRSGDVAGAAKMFHTTEENVTYEQTHKHFLATRKLLYEPGKGSSYSNHGFGLWTLLIEKISGKPYKTYVYDDYLKPLGLKDRVVGETTNPTSADAWNHAYSNGNPVPVPFTNSTLGLAAGGFRSSARDLARLMHNLSGKYTDAQLDSMGWGKGSDGRLSHNGLIEGGTAYAVMYPSGYKASGGQDLSRVHVAVITNIWTDTGDLTDLATNIALQVPGAKAPDWYDIWKGKPAK